MEYKEREYPMFSACGLNCGLCPRYQMKGISKCPGCAGVGFSTRHPACGILSCSQRKNIEYCFQCEEFPCQKYENANKRDSFITHLHQLKDLEKAKTNGIEEYKKELDEKIELLETMLEEYDDGRRKSFFCLAVNLLSLQDIKTILEQLRIGDKEGKSKKEKAEYAAFLCNAAAEKNRLALKLRKK